MNNSKTRSKKIPSPKSQMANNPKNCCSDVFDIKQIERLVDLMKSNDLSEIILQQADVHIELKRNMPPQINAVAVPQVIQQQTHLPINATKKEHDNQKENTTNNKNEHVIKSPMVGTFYAATSPDAQPLVKIGDNVTPDKTICLIEAMKVYNEIQAECSGKIVAILVKNGEAVEFGKPLFKIETE
ncbi:MAG: acetyl-CoA carboxylase biotin carboxyl carrier protein [Planctomycetaceae bacterium]|jgi:acetyl-CoA carboxylase biotin carboxyl carrier protein|nr:acetyl-CoA carboxylase biotin carboxyl carrier protein [Planctomycetaceae bacterium]